eukprot:s548_g11.t1
MIRVFKCWWYFSFASTFVKRVARLLTVRSNALCRFFNSARIFCSSAACTTPDCNYPDAPSLWISDGNQFCTGLANHEHPHYSLLAGTPPATSAPGIGSLRSW